MDGTKTTTSSLEVQAPSVHRNIFCVDRSGTLRKLLIKVLEGVGNLSAAEKALATKVGSTLSGIDWRDESNFAALTTAIKAEDLLTHGVLKGHSPRTFVQSVVPTTLAVSVGVNPDTGEDEVCHVPKSCGEIILLFLCGQNLCDAPSMDKTTLKFSECLESSAVRHSLGRLIWVLAASPSPLFFHSKTLDVFASPSDFGLQNLVSHCQSSDLVSFASLVAVNPEFYDSTFPNAIKRLVHCLVALKEDFVKYAESLREQYSGDDVPMETVSLASQVASVIPRRFFPFRSLIPQGPYFLGVRRYGDPTWYFMTFEFLGSLLFFVLFEPFPERMVTKMKKIEMYHRASEKKWKLGRDSAMDMEPVTNAHLLLVMGPGVAVTRPKRKGTLQMQRWELLSALKWEQCRQ